MLVGGFEIIPAGESGSEHEDGGFGCVEIGDETVDDLELKAGVNENIVLTEGLASFSPEFKRASDGGADGDDAVAGGLRGFDGFYSIGGEEKPFGMHMMILDVIAADGQKCAEANVESEIFYLDAFGLEFGEERFCHVETGRRSSGRAELFGPDGLVTLDILLVGVAVEIRRKRDVAVIGDDLSEVATGGDSSSAVAENFVDGNDVVGLGAIGDVFNGKLVASMKFAAIHDMVDFVVVFFEYDEFAWAAVGQLSKDARAHDAGIVEDE